MLVNMVPDDGSTRPIAERPIFSTLPEPDAGRYNTTTNRQRLTSTVV